MLRALKTAATGMSAQELLIDAIANNLANVNTVGFKAQRVSFEDLLYQLVKEPGQLIYRNVRTPTGLELGCGTQLASTVRDFTQGKVLQTNNPLDMMIDGQGFFKVQLPDGRFAYTRDGAFKISADGLVVTSEGYPLYPYIYVPDDAQDIIVSKDGIVQAVYNDQVEPEEIGRIELTRFVNPQGLRSIGNNLYVETVASGTPIDGTPGEEGLGVVVQRYLETSNVDIVKEMVNMIVAQRAYEISSRVIRSADRMFEVVAGMVRA